MAPVVLIYIQIRSWKRKGPGSATCGTYPWSFVTRIFHLFFKIILSTVQASACCLLFILLWLPNKVWETYCVCFLSYYYSYYYYYYYYYYSFFLPSKVCPTHISEMPWSNFMKPCRNIICHVKLSFSSVDFFKMDAVAMEMVKILKKLKNTKIIIAGYSPNRNWWNLIGTTSTSSGTR